MNQPIVDSLAQQWLNAKADEEAARKLRVEIEQKLLEQQSIEQKENGSATTNTGSFKVTITNKTNRKLDVAAWDALRSQLREDLRSVVVYKPALDEKGVKYIQANEPDQYKILAQCITNSPAKPGVKVAAVESK